ncbi:MAG: hypothetical protein ACYDCL_14995 [Myxococcales bacterium]
MRWGLHAALGMLAACAGDPTPVAGTQLLMDYTRAGGFYASPFPCESRRLPSGRIDMTGFPNPSDVAQVGQLVELAASEADGFGLSSGIFFAASGAVDPASLPDLHESVAAGTSVFLLGVDPSSPDYLRRLPVSVAFESDGGPYGAKDLLSLLPLQGLPLQPSTTYAAVITRAVRDASGRPLGVPLSMAQLAAGVQPSGMGEAAFGAYLRAIEAIEAVGVGRPEIAGLTVFRTWDPVSQMLPFRDAALALPPPVPAAPFVRHEVFDDYCVYQTTIGMPDYQGGDPPFTAEGGEWVEVGGVPALQRRELANFVVTLPRRPMPQAGFPVAVFSRTGAGGYRPLVDRGTEAIPGGPAITPGTGPALYYAMAGWAGVSIDGPLGALRNPTNGNEDLLIFNVANAVALRDNIRESALELILTAHLLDGIAIDASDCPGVAVPGGGPVRFDTAHEGLQGHSMGATITPLAFALEPRYLGGIFDGEGGSWIENVVYKQSPIDVLPVANLLFAVPAGYSLNEHDPLLSLLQWDGEPADPPVYAVRALRQPQGAPARHVLMFQGIFDSYILPPIANASSLAFGLDLASPAYDESASEAAYTPLEALLDLSGRIERTLPASGNVVAGDGSSVTALVVQHPGDGIEDGHEMMFQTDPPKHQYRCFLQTLLAGTPTVPADGAATDPCPE